MNRTISAPTKRIIGIDIARGLAIIGMVTAHIGPLGFLGAHNPTDGYPSALFAVLAGVSMSIMASGSRKQLVLRGVLLSLLAVVLGLVQQSIAVVLFEISLTFMLLWWLPAVATAWQVLSVIGLLGASAVMAAVVFPNQPYPILGWMAYGAFGALLHRIFIPATPRTHLVYGLLGVAVGACGVVIRIGEGDPQLKTNLWLAATAAHSGGIFDLLFSLGAAVGVIGLSLYLGNNCFLKPVQAMGSMALTCYLVHIISAGPLLDYQVARFNEEQAKIHQASALQVPGVPTRVEEEAVRQSEAPGKPQETAGAAADLGGSSKEETLYSHPVLWVGTIAGLMLGASVWKARFRRGPAEWVMYRVLEAAVPRKAKGVG